jgi:hypothetical protein
MQHTFRARRRDGKPGAEFALIGSHTSTAMITYGGAVYRRYAGCVGCGAPDYNTSRMQRARI